MVFEKVVALIAEHFNVDEDSVTMETTFESDLNADSLDIVEFIMALEEEFDIEAMDDEDASAFTAVGDLVRFLQSRMD